MSSCTRACALLCFLILSLSSMNTLPIPLLSLPRFEKIPGTWEWFKVEWRVPSAVRASSLPEKAPAEVRAVFFPICSCPTGAPGSARADGQHSSSGSYPCSSSRQCSCEAWCCPAHRHECVQSEPRSQRVIFEWIVTAVDSLLSTVILEVVEHQPEGNREMQIWFSLLVTTLWFLLPTAPTSGIHDFLGSDSSLSL